MDKAIGRETGRPRRLRIRTDKPLSPLLPLSTASRSGAGEGIRATAAGRHNAAKTDCPSDATCSRRKAGGEILSAGQAITPAKPPHPSNCSTHHATSLPACTTTSLSSASPAAAQAGACTCHGGATSASQPPAAESLANAGISRLISPMLQRSTRNSVKFPRGQPPPGNSPSSSAWPLGMVLAGRLASVSPRQTSPLASTSAKTVGNGRAFMRAWKPLRESGRRPPPRWRIQLRRG